MAFGGVVGFSLLFGFAGLYVLLTQRAPSSAAAVDSAAGPAIAVLPFRVAGPDAELWREGMLDLFYNNLDGVAGLRAIDPRAVLTRWRSDIGAGQDAPDPERALGVARGVGATYALLGNMVGSGNAVRLTAEVHDLADGSSYRAQVEGSPDSVLALVDQLCLEVLGAGLVPGSALPRLNLAEATTSSLPALKAYLAGEQKYRGSRFREAIADFQTAIDEDSMFAIAIGRISDAYGWIEPFGEQSSYYSTRAEELSERLPQRVQLLLHGRAGIERFEEAGIKALEEFTTRYPDDVEGWNVLGDVYFHVGDRAVIPRDRYVEAYRRALELDPGFGPNYIHLIDHAFVNQDGAQARELIARHRALDPTSPHARGLALIYAMTFGDGAARAEAYAALDTAGTDALVTAFSRTYWVGNFFPEQTMAVGRALLDPRHGGRPRELGSLGVIRSLVSRGRIREAHDSMVATWTMLASDPGGVFAAQADVLWYLGGFSDPEMAERATGVLLADSLWSSRFYVGAFAAAQGRWDDGAAAIRMLDSEVERSHAEGDSASAIGAQAFADALRGYVALRREEYDRAAQHFESALPGLSDLGIQALLRYEYARLKLEAGETEEALRFFESLQFYAQFVEAVLLTGPTEYYLGTIAEARGDIETAKLHYARLVNWWEGADDELRPLWDRGRQALERLAGEEGGNR